MTEALPVQLHNCETVREIDAAAIEDGKIPGIQLMKRAGRAALAVLLEQWPLVEHIIVLCGGGNNGGDGYILAALASQKKIPCTVYALTDVAKLQGDAQRAFEYARQQAADIRPSTSFALPSEANVVVVDAILGIGYKGPLRKPVGDIICAINDAQLPILSLDLPSGLDANTGWVEDCAVEADVTLSFVALKQGLFTGKGRTYSGRVYFDDLGVTDAVYTSFQAKTRRISSVPILPKRHAHAHKGDFGHVLVAGGDLGMGGAAIMAAEAALSSGAGLVSMATRQEHCVAVLARLPEVMARGLSAGSELGALTKSASVVVLGPGLGRSAWSEQILYYALKTELPTVVDADALNLIAGQDTSWGGHDWVITPHPGEASRLLGCSTDDIQKDRFAAARQLQKKFGCTVVLKGAGTLVASVEETVLVDAGNPGMATAGMGDVLAGTIGALIAQGLSTKEAAIVGATAHAIAGDRAAEAGQRGVRATDLIPYIRTLLNAQ